MFVDIVFHLAEKAVEMCGRGVMVRCKIGSFRCAHVALYCRAARHWWSDKCVPSDLNSHTLSVIYIHMVHTHTVYTHTHTQTCVCMCRHGTKKEQKC